MDNTSLINLKVYLTLLYILYCLCNIHSHSTALRVRHQATGTEYTTQRTYLTHARRHGDDDIYICPSTFDFLDIFIKTNIISTCLFGSCLLIRGTESQHARNLTCSVRKRYHATHHLVSLTRVYTQTYVHIYRSVKLSSGNFLHQFGSLLQCVDLPCFNLLSY